MIATGVFSIVLLLSAVTRIAREWAESLQQASTLVIIVAAIVFFVPLVLIVVGAIGWALLEAIGVLEF